MEKFLGKFKVVPELTEGFDNYFDAMKIPEETRETLRDNKELVTCLFQEADGSFRESNDYGNSKEEFVFKLGVPSTTSTAGTETKNTFTLNGDRIDGVHEVGGQATTSSRYYQGDLLVFEATGNGATMKTFFKRISS